MSIYLLAGENFSNDFVDIEQIALTQLPVQHIELPRNSLQHFKKGRVLGDLLYFRSLPLDGSSRTTPQPQQVTGQYTGVGNQPCVMHLEGYAFSLCDFTFRCKAEQSEAQGTLENL